MSSSLLGYHNQPTPSRQLSLGRLFRCKCCCKEVRLYDYPI